MNFRRRRKTASPVCLTLVLVSATAARSEAAPITPAEAAPITPAEAAPITPAAAAPITPAAAAPIAPAAKLTDATFQVRGLAGKCLTFGKLRTRPGGTPFENDDPVFLYDCNGTLNQQVRVMEFSLGVYRNGTIRPREVQLRAGDKCIDAAANAIVPHVPLVLQDCDGSRGQIFALDGDSIIFAQERNLVVEVRNAPSQNGTLLVVGERDLDDSEFWSFTATDGSNTKPTSGFVRAGFVRI